MLFKRILRIIKNLNKEINFLLNNLKLNSSFLLTSIKGIFNKSRINFHFLQKFATINKRINENHF